MIPDRPDPVRSSPASPTVSVVVPVYNSEPTLAELVGRLEGVFAPLGSEFEILLVNDGSPDGSWKTIEELAATHESVRGFNLMRNYGQHNALLCGIRAARFDVIVTLDDDLQNPPEEIPVLLAALASGADVVYGTPHQEQHGFWRDVASRISKLVLQNAMGAETARKVSAFRGFRTRLREAFENYDSSFVSIDVLLTWATTRFASVEVRHEPRMVGRSNYTFRKLVTHAANMLTGFSIIPLQVASYLGFATAVFGMVLLAVVLIRYVLDGGVVPGFSFLACAIAIFSGVQLFALGVIGEYIARMHFRIMNRPSYVVATTLAGNERA